jgi:hypothetical protein
MEPRVFKALLHFIYTDTLPWVIEGDEIAIAIGPLVAAEKVWHDQARVDL